MDIETKHKKELSMWKMRYYMLRRASRRVEVCQLLVDNEPSQENKDGLIDAVNDLINTLKIAEKGEK